MMEMFLNDVDGTWKKKDTIVEVSSSVTYFVMRSIIPISTEQI